VVIYSRFVWAEKPKSSSAAELAELASATSTSTPHLFHCFLGLPGLLLSGAMTHGRWPLGLFGGGVVLDRSSNGGSATETDCHSVGKV